MIREDDLKKNRHVKDTSATVVSSSRSIRESNTITENSCDARKKHNSHIPLSKKNNTPAHASAPSSVNATMTPKEIDRMIREMSKLNPEDIKEKKARASSTAGQLRHEPKPQKYVSTPANHPKHPADTVASGSSSMHLSDSMSSSAMDDTSDNASNSTTHQSFEPEPSKPAHTHITPPPSPANSHDHDSESIMSTHSQVTEETAPQSGPPVDSSVPEPENSTDIDSELRSAETSIDESLKATVEKITSLKKEIDTLRESNENMRRMYIDGFLTKSSYENTTSNIEHSIRRDKENISIETEREVMDALKKKVDKEISTALKLNILDQDSGDIETDLDRARKLFEYKVIDEKTYDELKSKILNRMDHGKSLIKDVNSVIDGNFNRYVESFADHSPETEPVQTGNTIPKDASPPESETKKDLIAIIPSESSPKQKNLKSRIKSIFNIRKKDSSESDILDSIRVSEELEKVRHIESKRDAIIEARFLLKKEIQKKLGLDEEMTYAKLAEKLEGLESDPEFRKELIDFFKSTSDAEYKGFIKEDEFTAIYASVARYMQKLSSMSFRPIMPKKDADKKEGKATKR